MSPTIREDCPCPNTSCKRHTLCDECEASRLAHNKLPFCKRPETSSWDRIARLFRRGK
jgi:hypothetical protein